MRFFCSGINLKGVSKAVRLTLFSGSTFEFKGITFSHFLVSGEGKRGKRHICVPLSGMIQKFLLPIDWNPWPHRATKEARKSGVRQACPPL